MTARLLLFFYFNFFFYCLWAQKVEDLDFVVKKTENSNTHVVDILAGEIRKSSRTDDFPKTLNQIQSGQNTELFFKSVADKTNSNMTLHRVGVTTAEIGFLGVQMATNRVPVLGELLSYSFEKVIDKMDAEGEKAISLSLNSKLNSYLKTEGRAKYDDIVKAEIKTPEDAEEFLKKLNKGLSPMDNDLLKDVPSEFQDDVTRFYLKNATDVLKNGVAAIANNQAATDKELGQVKTDIVGLSVQLSTYMKSNQKAMEGIVQTQNDILKEMDGFKKVTDKKFGFVFDFMYTRMTLKERKEALQSGIFGDKMKKSQIAEELKKIDILEKQEKLHKDISKWLGWGKDIETIGTNLKVDPKTMKPISGAVNIASSLYSAYNAFSSVPPNYLSAVSAVSSLFGGRKPDPNAEIMKRLNQIYNKVIVIDGKVDKVLKNQETILENQQKIFNEIVKLELDVEKNQIELLRYIDHLENEIFDNRRIAIEPKLSDYADCEKFIPIPSRGQGFINTKENKLPSLIEFKRRYFANVDRCRACERRFNSIHSVGGYDAVFRTSSYKQANNKYAVGMLVDSVFQNSLALIEQTIFPFSIEKDKRKLYLFYPVNTTKALATKLDCVKVSPQQELRFENDLLEPSIVAYHTDILKNFHLFYLYIDPVSKNPKTYEQIKNEDVVETGKNALNENLELINSAIAQQLLSSGDILLPILSSVLNYKDSMSLQQKIIYRKCITLLNSNDELCANFLMYEFQNQLRTKGDDQFIAYMIARNEATTFGDFNGLKHLTTLPWEFIYSNKSEKSIPLGASIKIGYKYYNLPSYADLVSGKLNFSPEYYLLLEKRDEVIREISSYDIYKEFNKENLEILNSFLVR